MTKNLPGLNNPLRHGKAVTPPFTKGRQDGSLRQNKALALQFRMTFCFVMSNQGKIYVIIPYICWQKRFGMVIYNCKKMR